MGNFFFLVFIIGTFFTAVALGRGTRNSLFGIRVANLTDDCENNTPDYHVFIPMPGKPECDSYYYSKAMDQYMLWNSATSMVDYYSPSMELIDSN